MKSPKLSTVAANLLQYGSKRPLNTKIVKLDFGNQLGFDFEGVKIIKLLYKIENLTKPKMTIPFDYNLLNLVVYQEYMVYPTTFIAKMSKFRGTSVLLTLNIRETIVANLQGLNLADCRCQFLHFLALLGYKSKFWKRP